MRALGKSCTFTYFDGARHGFAVRTHPGYAEDPARQSFDEARRFRSHRLSRLAAVREQRAWRAADLVVVPSAVLGDYVHAAGQPHVLVAPNGVSAVGSQVSAATAQELRRRLGLDGRFVVGFVGSLMPWHDLETVIAGLGLLPAELEPALLVVGDGPCREEVAGRSRRAGLHAVFTGRVAHHLVPEHLAVMDACVSSLMNDPALRYFSPLKAMEYFAAGRPTVVAAAGDLRGVVAAGAALGYRPGDPTSLADQLARLATSSTRRRARGSDRIDSR